MAHGELKDIDRGWRAAVADIAAAAGKPNANVTVGWPASAGQHVRANMSVAQLAAIHEFGTARIPKRSMLAATFEQNADRYALALRQIAVGIAFGKVDLRRGLSLFGAMVKGDVMKRIAQGIPPPNAPSTIARKGSSTPLIHTGQLRTSLDFEVRDA